MNKYEKEWAEIESLRRQGLPKSLFSKVDSVYRSALAEGNYEQLIKAVIFRINSIGLLKENDEGANRIFNDLKKDAERLPQPVGSVIYSMIGQMYEVFYDENIRRISLRTNTATDTEDIHTWDARKLAEEAMKYYNLSLRDAAALQREPIDGYKAILLEGYDPGYQPTLYDLLANRALAYYASDYNVLPLAQQPFTADNPDFFADAQTFSTLTIRSEDTLSPVYLSLTIWQELLRFHLKKSNFGSLSAGKASGDITALVEVDLRRMAYVWQKGRYADNDAMYEQALVAMSEAYKPYDANAAVLLRLGGLYTDRGRAWRDDKKEEHKSGYAKAYEMYKRIRKEYPGRLEGNVRALKEHVLYRELDIRFEATQLPGKPFLALLHFRNMDSLYRTVYRLTEEQAVDYTHHAGNYKNGKRYDLPDFIRTLTVEPVKDRLKLPVQADYQYYTTEIGMAPYEKGFYLVIVSDSENPPSSSSIYNASLLQVSSLAAQDRIIDRVMTVIVTDRETGKPVPGATVEAYGGKMRRLMAPFTSNENGVARGRKVPADEYSRYYGVDCREDRLLVFGNTYNRTVYGQYDSKQAVLFTDRSVYRPGQIVYFKAILYNRKENEARELLKWHIVRVCLRDANRQVVSEQQLMANDFGSIDGSFTIPQGLLNGEMTVECADYASTRIRVEEYKRPTFEVKFDPVEGNPALNVPVRVTAEARALAGYAVDGAAVRYRVVRNVRYRYDYGWPPPVNDSREISSGVVKTDGKGRFAVDFTALADDVTDDRIYTYTVSADVTDVSGETRSASVQVHAGNKPLLVDTDLPDVIPPGQPGTYTVKTTNLNGDFTPARVNVKIIALRTPGKIRRRRVWKDVKTDLQAIPEDVFRKDFPLDAYAGESDPDKLEELKTVAACTIETAEKKTLDLSSMKRSGYYRIALTADNGKGLTAEHVRYVYWPGVEPEEIPDMDQWLTVVKDSGEPGEQAEFRVAGGHNDSYVYCELIHKDRVLEAKWLTTGTTPRQLVFPLREEHRGGLELQLTMVRDNRIYQSVRQITVPYTNKMLDVKLATFRDKLLPGEQETWTMRVSDRKGGKETAEIVASLYDASLDAIQPHDWPGFTSLYDRFVNGYAYRWNTSSIERLSEPCETHDAEYPASWQHTVFLTDINWYDATYKYVFSPYHGLVFYHAENMSVDAEEEVIVTAYGRAAAEPLPPSPRQEEKKAEATVAAPQGRIARKEAGASPAADPASVATRTDFNETAFFYPALRTNGQGEALVEFTMPEALTRWKLLSFAHTKNLKAGAYSNELITQKQVAISAHLPRFFRENDEIELTARVNNLTGSPLNGQALLRLYDAVTMEPVDDAVIRSAPAAPFSVKSGGSAGLRWKLAIPEGIQAIVCKVTAQAGTHTDGEERTVPVLTNSALVTETLPFGIRAGKEKTLTLDKLAGNESATLRHHSLTLEITSAPAWYALQALPYMMEYPYECAEQTFARYYANTLATTIVHKTPRIRQIFERWNTPESGALMSNLEKNRELKQVMLEETPWVMQAKSETERRKRIGLLFDLNRMSSELNRAFDKLRKMQHDDGGFPWFEGNPSDRYITQHIIAGMAHLKKLDAMQTDRLPDAEAIVRKGLAYLDAGILRDYDELIRRKADMKARQVISVQLHYLYTCSFSRHRPDGKRSEEAFRYYLAQAGKYWPAFSTGEKAMAALVLNRYGEPDRAKAIIRSLREHAQQSEELGMYWKDNVAGYFRHQTPVETQAMLIEAFDEAAKDKSAVEEMKIWLLRNKQTNDWKTTKATSEAIYALLMTGSNLLDESQLPEIEIGGKPLAQAAGEPIRPEPGTGYVKTGWPGGDVTPRMGILTVKNPNGKGIAWGGLYWQYFEQLDKITTAETNLRMKKQLFLRTLTAKGEELQPVDEAAGRLKVGDRVCVRMELRADRDYEYVHLKDMRASGLEPVDTRSGHRYRDGLWYYESIKDASTNFFITSLHKGTYVFEYDLRVSHAGDFSNGVTTFQCMYAPEFSSHSEGIRVHVSDSDDESLTQ